MQVPTARGPVSRYVLQVLRGTDSETVDLPDGDLLVDDDVQLALWVLYELYYRGFDDVPADAEWDPRLIAIRRRIEERIEQELRTATAARVASVRDSGDVGQEVLDLAERADGPSVAAFLQRHATADQMCDYLRQRSVSQLKESDPHSFVLARLEGPAKVALAEVQYDEYGGGQPHRLHAAMYAAALQGAGLDPAYGSYIDEVCGPVLAAANVMSLFAINRRFTAASMGHLAVFEATSSLPCRKIAAGIARLGFPDVVAAYFEEHVEADAVHEQIAARDICGALVATDPGLRDDVLFGAAACRTSMTWPVPSCWIAGPHSGRWPHERSGERACVSGRTGTGPRG